MSIRTASSFFKALNNTRSLYNSTTTSTSPLLRASGHYRTSYIIFTTSSPSKQQQQQQLSLRSYSSSTQQPSSSSPSSSSSTPNNITDSTTGGDQQQQQNNKNEIDMSNKSLLFRFMNNTYEYPPWSTKWILEKAYQCVIFGMTGSSALIVVRYLLKNLWQVDGTVFGGPWQYTAAYFITMFSCYPFVLLFYGTLFGRHQFFKKFFLRMTVAFPKRIYNMLASKGKKQ
ncbi:hypothetical protein SAMD00019534_070220 [Acytostelium subglobosum LB1]|uniref:hypothetical protein n=1 Tax=Acytostelium subglobosum LB1 TaxID=1410327 RepID=UPI00064505A8|nr:hypothetical protein SAMD00019534_070220 [Acytostelium subglobosum LB1]GAM23847.1 hypothetical protein SAMD00019534_070220 [Acytostelium subglobosum LB1]|eukprot:XP_012752883.1 hypothetical protein SAMD00019534_070220 [Acytostelium subglobosum LB1]